MSYPPIPYPPSDIWDADDFKLPGPAFDMSTLNQFKRGANDGYLCESDSLSMAAPTSSGLSLSLSGMDLVGEDLDELDAVSDRKRRRTSDVNEVTKAPSERLGLGLAVDRREPQDWQIKLRDCLSGDVTEAWGL